MVYRHEKTGARICVISCQDVQKTFQIAFPTVPADDTGAAHIVEHAVFCGSQKFPVKDVFAECEKGSVQTFLNAMTYPDRTVYPVASCNETDFRNLIQLYLDSVFHPLFHEREEIFRQEGWRYAYDETDQTLSVNGIVYNEMKGAYGSADAVFCRDAERALFAGTLYGYDSGGLCQHIPELTYEAFCQFHQRYYHPSNCYVYLYGDMEYAPLLEWMDQAYFSQYDAVAPVDLQEIVAEQTAAAQTDEKKGWQHLYLPVPAEEDEDAQNQSAYLLQVKAGSPLDLQTAEALDILSEVIVEASGAPLKKALLQAGIGQSVSSSYDCETLLPSWSIEVQDGKAGQLKAFQQVIRDTVSGLCEKGIERDSLLAAIHMREFSIREGEFDNPPGVEYGLQILNSWIYDETQAFLWLKRLAVCRKLRKLADTGYFEHLLQEVFLQAQEGIWAEMIPVSNLAEQEERQEEERLAAKCAALSKTELEQIRETECRLFQYQMMPDSPESLQSIPRVKLSDLSRDSVRLYNETLTVGGQVCIWHPVATNGIIYWRAHFALPQLDQQQLHLLGAATAMLGGLDTKIYPYERLSTQARLYTGGMSFYIETYADQTDPDWFTPMLVAEMRVLEGNFAKGLDLVESVLFSSCFSKQKRWKELLMQMMTRLKNDIQYDSGYYVRKRALSYFAPQERLLEQVNGISFYETIRAWAAAPETEQKTVAKEMAGVLNKVLQADACLFDMTASEQGRTEAMKGMESFLSALSAADPGLNAYRIENGSFQWNANAVKSFTTANGMEGSGESAVQAQAPNEAFVLSVGGFHTAFGGNFKKAGFPYTGVLDVVKTILNTEYLYQTVRLKGGAYGYGIRLYTISGSLLFYSDDDPNCEETFAAYEQAAAYIAGLDLSKQELEPYLIGTIGIEDLPLSARQVGEQSFQAYMNGFGEADYRRERDEIFDATIEQIRETGGLLAAVAKEGCRCCCGTKKKLEQTKGLFTSIRKIRFS